jgi:hypothetical protein
MGIDPSLLPETFTTVSLQLALLYLATLADLHLFILKERATGTFRARTSRFIHSFLMFFHLLLRSILYLLYSSTSTTVTTSLHAVARRDNSKVCRDLGSQSIGRAFLHLSLYHSFIRFPRDICATSSTQGKVASCYALHSLKAGVSIRRIIGRQ